MEGLNIKCFCWKKTGPYLPKNYGAAEIVDNYIYFSHSDIPLLFITSRIDFSTYILCCIFDINKLFILNNCILWFTWCSRILWVLTNVKWHVSRMKASYRACHCPKGPLCSAYSVLPPPLSPSPLETTDLFADSIVLPFLECRIVGIVQENIRHFTC